MKNITRRAVIHPSIEFFFANLPLVVAWINWPISGSHAEGGFWHSAEPSLIASVLYGLSLSRFIYGTIMRAGVSAFDKHRSADIAAINTAFALIPLAGVISSSITIIYFMNQMASSFAYYWQIANTLISSVCFFGFAIIGQAHIEEVG